MASARYREAIEDMIIVIQMFPRDDEAVALIGDCLFQLGNHSEASGRYLESITLNPKNKRALRGLLALADLP
jgi:Flp pilus assembly protein TadD